jgi:MFS family permease
VTRRATQGGRLGAAYWRLWAAGVVSNLGDGVSMVAYPWLAGTLTREPVLIAAAAAATRLPWLLFSLPAGALIDRGDRRRIMIGANTARFAITLVVALTVLTGTMRLPLLYLSALLLGIAEVAYDNAAQTILPRLVPPERLERANGNMWSAETIVNNFVGPPLGGFLIAAGLWLPFVLDAGSFGASAGLILLIGGTFRTTRPDTEPGAAPPKRSLRREIGEGVGWLRGNVLLRTLALLLGAMNMLLNAVGATQVLFVQELLGLDSRGYGILLAATAVGGVIGAQITPWVSRRIGAGSTLRLAMGIGALTFLVSGLAPNAFVYAAAGFAEGIMVLLWNVVTVSLRQAIIPDHLLGRVNSVYRFLGWGTSPVGGLLGGLLVTWAGVLAGREAGLRSPYLIAAAAQALMFFGAWRVLSNARVEAARSGTQAAGPA